MVIFYSYVSLPEGTFQVWMISISSDPPRHGQAVGPSVVLGLRLPVDIHCQVACLDIMVSTRPTCRLTRVAWCVAAAFLSYKTVPQVYPHQIPVLEIRPHKMLHALQIKSSQKYGRNIKTMCSRQLIELGIVQSCCQTQPPDVREIDHQPIAEMSMDWFFRETSKRRVPWSGEDLWYSLVSGFWFPLKPIHSWLGLCPTSGRLSLRTNLYRLLGGTMEVGGAGSGFLRVLLEIYHLFFIGYKQGASLANFTCLLEIDHLFWDRKSI